MTIKEIITLPLITSKTTTRDFTLSGVVTVSDEMIEEMIESAGYVQHGWNAGGSYDPEKRSFTIRLEPDCEVNGKRKFTISYDRVVDAFVTLGTERDPRPAIREHLLLLATGNEYGSSEMDAYEYDAIVQHALFGEVIFG